MARKVLVVDDEGLVTRTIDRLLTKHNYEVVVAQDAKQALECVARIDFDLIISDVRMPGKSGVEMIRDIRALLIQSGKKPIPEILMTGFASDNLTREAESLGVTEYIYKPFDIAEFIRVVEKHIKKS